MVIRKGRSMNPSQLKSIGDSMQQAGKEKDPEVGIFELK